MSILPFGFKSFVVYLTGFLQVCTSSWGNFLECAAVHRYVPGYIHDSIEFVRYEPYERERISLDK